MPNARPTHHDFERLKKLMQGAGIQVVQVRSTDATDSATPDEVLWSILQHYVLHPPPGRIPLSLVGGLRLPLPADTPAPIATPEEVAAVIVKQLWTKPRPLCRDCADEDGVCPTTGEACDPWSILVSAIKARDFRHASALSTLKEENERLRERLRLANTVHTEHMDRLVRENATLTETVGRLREALRPFSAFAGELFARNYNRHYTVARLFDPHGREIVATAGHFFDARAALSTEPTKET